MPTFDVVSEVDKHELTNAIDQANRELATRFDFKGTDAKFELEGFVVTQVASSAFQLKQMLDILRGRLSARGIDVRCLDVADPLENLGGARQKVTIKQGIEQPVAKKLIAAIKNAKLKVCLFYTSQRIIVMDDLLILGLGPRLPQALTQLKQEAAHAMAR